MRACPEQVEGCWRWGMRSFSESAVHGKMSECLLVLCGAVSPPMASAMALQIVEATMTSQIHALRTRFER
jgi:hypothetical protein